MSLLHLRFETLFAVLTFAATTLAAIYPIDAANTIMRRPVARPGDPAFTLFYRSVAGLGAAAALYILIGDLWKLAHR